ncbi:MAG: PH domain-containing protein [Verrucomicrobiales bacterium]
MAAERFYILKGGEREGPFDESYVRFLLENDEIGFEDFCETPDGKRIRLGALYEPVEGAEGGGGNSEAESRRASAGERRQRSAPRPGKILYHGHPSFLRYPVAWCLVLAGSLGGYWLGPHSLAGMLAGFGIAVMAFFYIVLSRSSHVYVITPRRLEAVHGLVAKDSTEIRIEDVRTINVRRSGLPGLFGVGTMEFSSTGDAIDVSFADIWGARRLKKLVRRLQDDLET